MQRFTEILQTEQLGHHRLGVLPHHRSATL